MKNDINYIIYTEMIVIFMYNVIITLKVIIFFNFLTNLFYRWVQKSFTFFIVLDKLYIYEVCIYKYNIFKNNMLLCIHWNAILKNLVLGFIFLNIYNLCICIRTYIHIHTCNIRAHIRRRWEGEGHDLYLSRRRETLRLNY